MLRFHIKSLVTGVTIILIGGTLVAMHSRFYKLLRDTKHETSFRGKRNYNYLFTHEELPQNAKSQENTSEFALKLKRKEKFWFMKKGCIRPEDLSGNTEMFSKIWPHQNKGDRIINQLMYVPPNYSNRSKVKVIYLTWSNDMLMGNEYFVRNKCPVSRCELTDDDADASTADAVLYKDWIPNPASGDPFMRPPHQLWILHYLECPYHAPQLFPRSTFNLTATYRHDSDIVAPYEKFVLYDENVRFKKSKKNYAAGKKKKVAAFMSNCAAQNQRLEYAVELAKYIDVDIYGSCGNETCPKWEEGKCLRKLQDEYKFFLSFENSNCFDYITEKFFVKGLGINIIPVVMGARPKDYRRSAPYNSYINVEDYKSPKALAEYLILLDKNDTLYNQYFQWKGTGEFINTYFWCRLCTILHSPLPQKKIYTSLQEWWSGEGVCRETFWKGP